MVNVGVIFVPQTRSEKLTAMASILAKLHTGTRSKVNSFFNMSTHPDFSGTIPDFSGFLPNTDAYLSRIRKILLFE